ncbi:MAG: DUF4132 domain-containing protein [Firmicutes bacterium]|jgi:hypothetical protein|nr:DUF4132 domain-containing protein [Bacillota bacterium]
MRILEKLKKYCSNYDKKIQKSIDDYINNGGDLLTIFDSVDNRLYYEINNYTWSWSYDVEYDDMNVRTFNLSAMLMEKDKIYKLDKAWINASFEKDPLVPSYLYVLANFRFNIVRLTRGDGNLSSNGYWYCEDYQKYKPYIDTIYENTSNEVLRAQIQFCRYINEDNKDSLDYVVNNISKYAKEMTNIKNEYAFIIYCLYKLDKINEYEDVDKAFTIIHKALYSLSGEIANEKREDFYMDEYSHMGAKFQLSNDCLSEIAKSIIYRSYREDISFKSITFSNNQYKEILEVIHSFNNTTDIASSLILYSYLIKQSKENDKYVNDFEDKLNRLFIEENEAKNNKEVIKDLMIGRKDKDQKIYHKFFANQRYSGYIDLSSSIMFGISTLATNYLVFRVMGYRLLKEYIYGRGNDKNKLKGLIDNGINENSLLSDIERNYAFNGDVRNSYYEYLDGNTEKYKERLKGELDDSVYEMLFNKYYYDMEVKDLEIALDGLKSKYKSVQRVSREYFLGRTEYNCELEVLLKEKLPKANKELIEYIIDYNKLQMMDIENTSLDSIVEEFYNPKKMNKPIDKLEIDILPEVRYENSSKVASKDLLKYYLATFLLSPTVELPLTASIIKSRLNKDDLNNLGRHIYNKWFGLGAVAKMKMAMVFAVYNCDEAFIMDFKKQIDEWTENSRGAIASEGVKAMAFHGSDYALMQLDAISRKYKNKMVKNTAAEYFLIAAKNMGLTKEELADLVIPNLDFDNKKELRLDYGSRIFTATLKEDLKIELSNPDGKIIKSLPKPGKSDDEDIAKASKKQLSAVKKQLKTIVASQKARLERGIFIERRWDMETFNKVFVNNPIMNMFAVNLVWGKYDSENNLVKSFRYMDDGTFADSDYEEIDLIEGDELGLVHPMDLSSEELDMWKENLEDNEIIQPIKQLEIEIVEIDDEKMNHTIYEEFNGVKIPAISLVSKLEKQGWYKTSIVDGGGYDGLFVEFEEVNYGAQIDGEHLYIGMGDEGITVRNLRFYKSGAVNRGSYVYDDINPSNIAKLSDVEPKFLNAVVSQLREICIK